MFEFKSLEEKVGFLIKANKAYRDGNPIISDDVYDYLENDVRNLNPDNSFFRKIEDDFFGLDKKLTIHMGSQDKAQNLKEMNRFYNRIDINEMISASEKMDGMSAELTYELIYRSGILVLVLVLSKGDGEYGVDITSMVRKAKNIPLRIYVDEGKIIVVRGKVVIRGEIIITKSDFRKLNEELIQDGRDPYQNTRNGTVGLVKTLKNRKYSKYLSFRAFDIIGVS